MNRFYITLVLLGCFCLPVQLDAQDQRARRREFVEDLLRGLLESQQNQQQQRPQVRPGTIPGQPTPGRRPPPRQPSQPRVIVETSPEMVRVRKALTRWDNVCGQLIEDMRVHEFESPQIRPMMADALKVRANVELLARKAQLYPTIQPLVQDFQVIDADWRMLNYRLNSMGGLSNQCASYVTTIAELDAQLCEAFQIQPQVNRVALQRLATKLSSDYNHLLQDVYYVVRDQPNGRQILTEGKQLQSMIAQSSALIPRGSYDSIVNSYNSCIGKWKGFSRQICAFGDPRIRRSVSDMEETGALIREQLWLPVEIDREYLSGMTMDVDRSAQRIFASISLADLMKCESPGIAMNSAREFHHACENFSHSIKSGEALEELQWDFRLFDVQWNDMHRMFQAMNIPKVNRRLDEIDYSMGTLRQTFGEAQPIDYHSMIDISSNLAALLRQTSNVVHQRVVAPRYQGGFPEQICGAADNCSGTAIALHNRLARNRNLNLREADLHPLFVQWRTLIPMINQCQEPDKRALLQLRSQIEPLMVKLQVVFAE